MLGIAPQTPLWNNSKKNVEFLKHPQLYLFFFLKQGHVELAPASTCLTEKRRAELKKRGAKQSKTGPKSDFFDFDQTYKKRYQLTQDQMDAI